MRCSQKLRSLKVAFRDDRAENSADQISNGVAKCDCIQWSLIFQPSQKWESFSGLLLKFEYELDYNQEWAKAEIKLSNQRKVALVEDSAIKISCISIGHYRNWNYHMSTSAAHLAWCHRQYQNLTLTISVSQLRNRVMKIEQNRGNLSYKIFQNLTPLYYTGIEVVLWKDIISIM